MTYKDLVRRFITVHKCVGCGEILDYECSDTAFCDKCRASWNWALNASCDVCLQPARECACITPKLKASGALVHRKLFIYKKESAELPQNRLIYVMKRKKHKRLSSFCADQLLPMIMEELDVLAIEPSDAVVTFVPRGRRSERKYGFDHAAMLASSVSLVLGAEYQPLLSTRLFSGVQKKLDRSGREQNAIHSIRIRDEASLGGRYVILVDDIVTTGASMAACVRLLMKHGAKGVLCFSVASNNKARKM